MPTGAELWVIVVNWNGATLLWTCLEALRSQTRSAQVVVVDNGSTDTSETVVAAFSGMRWLPLGANRGFAEGCNAGIRVALAGGARYVALVNTDVVLAPDWAERIVAAGEAHPEAGLFNGVLLFGDDPSRVNSTGIELDRLGRAFDRDFGTPAESLARNDGPIEAISGGAALLRAESLRRIGLFDPGYFAYYEDVDLSLRAARAGIGCRYVSGARAFHGYGRTFGPDAPRKRYLLARNHLRCAARNLPLARAVPLVVALPLLRVAVRAPLELLRGRPAHAAAHARGAVAGFTAAVGALARRARRD